MARFFVFLINYVFLTRNGFRNTAFCTFCHLIKSSTASSSGFELFFEKNIDRSVVVGVISICYKFREKIFSIVKLKSWEKPMFMMFSFQ